MNIPTFYALLAPEIGLVATLGVYAARHALRRQEIRHAMHVLEHQQSLLSLTQSQPVALLSSPATAPDTQKFDAEAGAEWLEKARAAAERICNAQGKVTSDDVWKECPPPDGVDGRLLGLVWRSKEWQKIGECHSERGHNLNRYIAVWTRREAQAA